MSDVADHRPARIRGRRARARHGLSNKDGPLVETLTSPQTRERCGNKAYGRSLSFDQSKVKHQCLVKHGLSVVEAAAQPVPRSRSSRLRFIDGRDWDNGPVSFLTNRRRSNSRSRLLKPLNRNNQTMTQRCIR